MFSIAVGKMAARMIFRRLDTNRNGILEFNEVWNAIGFLRGKQ